MGPRDAVDLAEVGCFLKIFSVFIIVDMDNLAAGCAGFSSKQKQTSRIVASGLSME